MKVYIKNLFLLSLLIASLGLISPNSLTAQTYFTNLHTFTAGIFDGANPYGRLILSSNTLYGTTLNGGSQSSGTVFAINADGTGYTNLHGFTTISGPIYNNIDGANPYCGLILSSNTLYGAAMNGGGGTNFGSGTIFAITTNGTGFRILHTFSQIHGSTNNDGASPYGGLILSGNTLYGTADQGGWYSAFVSSGNGTVFAVNADGTGFTNLHSFGPGNYNSSGQYVNSDGCNPRAELILSSNTLYGTAFQGGSYGYGTVFAINTNGTSFRILHNFTALSGSSPSTNSDGANPSAGLILSGNKLYGTASTGGKWGYGTVFAINTDGAGFTNIYNQYGISSYAGLILSGNALYGTAYVYNNAASDFGDVFAVNIDGTGIIDLHTFNYIAPGNNHINNDGFNPNAGLILSGNTLYGTATVGGSSGKGTLFSLTLPLTQLTLISSVSNVVLTWLAYPPGVTLQSTTNLGSAAVWSTNSLAPTLVNGQNTVTNSISGIQKFFRLSQ